MSLEIYLGLLVLAVLAAGAWMILQVLAVTFVDPERDMVDEVEQERAFLEAVQRAARR